MIICDMCRSERITTQSDGIIHCDTCGHDRQDSVPVETIEELRTKSEAYDHLVELLDRSSKVIITSLESGSTEVLASLPPARSGRLSKMRGFWRGNDPAKALKAAAEAGGRR